MRMNKSLSVIVIVCGVLFFSGCGVNRKLVNAAPALKKKLYLPEWVEYPAGKKIAHSFEKGYVYTAGSYSVLETDRDPDFAITLADQRARRRIQEYLASVIASVVRDFSQQAGYGDVESDEAVVAASVSMGALDVSAAQVIKREFRDGVIHSRVRWPLDGKKRDEILRAVREGLYGREALRSRFAAEQEWKKLEEILNRRMDANNGGEHSAGIAPAE